MPSWRASDGRGGPPKVSRYRSDVPRGARVPSFLKFIVFSGALAALVLVVLLTALRPIVRAGVVGWAWDNPSWITRIGFVEQMVKEDLGTTLDEAPSTDATESLFEVLPNDTILAIAPRLQEQGFVVNQRAFAYLAIRSDLQPHLQAGSFVLRRNMTPSEVVVALVRAKVTMQSVNITFREGIRLEQMTALLETIDSKVDPKAFYELAKHPTPELLASYPWLAQAGMPEGASLEGFLYPATYTLITGVDSGSGDFHVTTAEDLIRMELDKFYVTVGKDRMTVPSGRGLNFYQVVTLASIVEHEAPVDAERPKVAGVYQNRLNGLNGVPKLLNADPTVIWAVDTVALGKVDIATWKDYFFWEVPKGTKMSAVTLPKSLVGYQTYAHAGLIPGPIATPTLTSIDAALSPDTSGGYLYFVAIPGTGTHAFARTLAEQNANLKKYGYIP